MVMAEDLKKTKYVTIEIETSMTDYLELVLLLAQRRFHFEVSKYEL